jgi:hypothetical protein
MISALVQVCDLGTSDTKICRLGELGEADESGDKTRKSEANCRRERFIFLRGY